LKYLQAGALLWLGLASTSMVVNCQDRDVSRVAGAVLETPDAGEAALFDHCVPGQTFACMGGCGAPATGYQVCAADGRSYGSCICPPLRTLGPIPGLPDRDDGGRIIVMPRESQFGNLPLNSGVSSGVQGLVGAKCARRGDCISGLDCLTPGGGALNFSGPAGGYCSTGCGNDAACQAIDSGSECVTFAGQNICVRSCASRTTPSGVSKCLDRDDVMCVSVAALGDEPPGDGPQRGLCLPSCQSDAQCGAGLFCDLGNGLCTSERPAGDPVGSVCSGADSCASGLCLTLNDRFEGFCSGFCRFGGPGCGFDGSAASPGAGCALAQVPNEGVGDRGLCLELCQDASDCHEAGAVCIATAQGSSTRACVVPTGAPPVVTGPDAGTSPPLAGPPIGSECARAADCGAGRECLAQDADTFGLGGGLAGGYCSALCTNVACPEAGTVCVGVGDSAQHCLRACTPAPGGDGDCGERAGLVCVPFGNDQTTGFCLPDCRAGADCGALGCDPDLGVCVDGPLPEPSTGSACDSSDDCGAGLTCASQDTDSFAGAGGPPGGYCSATCTAQSPCPEAGAVCVGIGGGNGICLRACDPTADGDCGGRATVVCERFSNGDPALGFCRPQCNSSADCGERVCGPDGLCVDAPVEECSQDEDCTPQPQSCVNGSCVPALQSRECSEDSECAPGVCNTDSGQCLPAPTRCTDDTSCGAQECDLASGLCVDPPGACNSSAQCDAPQVCDTNAGECVAPPAECSADAECGVRRCDTASGACVDAACALDADCRVGVCNRATRLCSAAPAIAIGGSCTRNADCAGGRCLTLDGITGLCSAACTVGSDAGCEIYGSDALCVGLDPNQPTLTRCLELCSTAADCAQSSYECVPLGGPTLVNGRSGLCLPPLPPAPASP
jgi:hypothetical protein